MKSRYMLATVLGCIFATIAAAADHQWKVAGGVYNAGRHSANQCNDNSFPITAKRTK